MFHFKLYEHKNLYGMLYTFPRRGDGIGMHNHTEEQKHNCIVLKGTVELYGPNRCWSVTVRTGEIFDLLDEHHPHEVAALEDDTVMLGMFVNGKPVGENLPPQCWEGSIDFKPLTIGLP